MDMLKQYFPFSFQAKADVVALVINILIHFVVGLVISLALGLIGKILPFDIIGWILGIIGGVIDLYLLVGIVLSVLDYLKVLK